MMKKIILSIILVNLLAACASNKPKEVTNAPTTPTATTASTASTATAATTAAEPSQTATTAESGASVTTAAAGAEAAAPDNRSVFFPFDVDAVPAGDRATVQAHGAYLAKNKNAKVRVEGNADERGSSEYNLALGQRRANNVKKLLVLSGAKAAQIDTVSFGEEKPRATGHDEASWAQNRRADIIAK
jgi:peptidoglycan-associated lipoprotein